MPPDDPTLRPDPNLARALRLLQSWTPPDPERQRDRQRTLELIRRHPANAHRRSCLEGHLTASAVVVDRHFERILLLHHRKLGRWLQPGGHCDGDANLPGVALREVIEESGLQQLEVSPRLVDLDIHQIPARRGEPAHLHFDSRFLVHATADEEPSVSHESNAVRWFPWQDLSGLELDDSVQRLARLARNLDA